MSSSGLWFDHLAQTLASNGLVAYVWNVTQGKVEWQGDLQSVIGHDTPQPVTSGELNRLINPQDVPKRLAAIHGLTGVGDSTRSFSTTYRLRRANGMQINVAENGTMHCDDVTGDRLICGTLRILDNEQYIQSAARPASQAMLNNPFAYASYDTSMTHYGRLLICQKMNEWGQGEKTDENGIGYLLVVGIDRLSMFNEAFGASFTDEIIDLTGKRLRHLMASAGVVARIDGDVFALFFSNAPQAEMAAVAHHLLHYFHDSPLETSRGPLGVSVSIGGVVVHRECDAPANMLTKAEMAMRNAKDKGRARFVSYSEASSEAANTRALLDSGDAFLRALKNNRVRLAFQPVVNSQTHVVTFHESLIRFYDEQGKIHTAGSFMDAIEKMGLSRLLDRHAMRMALRELMMFKDLSLSVNVSNLTLNDPDWLRGLVNTLRDRPDIARRLIVEITESAVIYDIKKTISIVRTLRDLGCRVALDDFGSGYTAFSQIKDLDISMVKIDKSFIRGIDEKENHLFVRTLQALADGVNIETVGEGAETMSEARMLAEDGIHHIQGYAFGFPVVERVWLPKDHDQRKIHIPARYAFSAPDDMGEDIAAG